MSDEEFVKEAAKAFLTYKLRKHIENGEVEFVAGYSAMAAANYGSNFSDWPFPKDIFSSIERLVENKQLRFGPEDGGGLYFDYLCTSRNEWRRFTSHHRGQPIQSNVIGTPDCDVHLGLEPGEFLAQARLLFAFNKGFGK